MNRTARLSQMIVVLAFVVTIGLALKQTSFAASGSLSLSPSSGTHINGDTFTVSVIENSGSDAANAIDASVTFDSSKLQFISDTTVAPFNLNFNGTDSASGSTVFIQRGQLGTSSTGAQTVTTITFKAIGTGTASVSFNSGSSKIYSAADNSNLLTTSSGGSYTINAPAPAAPSITSFTASPATIASGDTSTLNWSASNVVSGGCNIGSSYTGGNGSGSWTTPVLTGTTSYTLTCKNSANVTTSKSVTVTVNGTSAAPGGTGNASNSGTNSSNKANSSKVNDITVSNNGKVDISAPSVTVGPATVQTEGVQKVEYYLDNKLVDTETKAPFTYKLDTTKLDGGQHKLTTKTYFDNGTTKSTTQNLNIKNTAKKVSNSSVGLTLALIAAIIGGIILIQRRRTRFHPADYVPVNAHEVVTSDSPRPAAVTPKPVTPAVPPPTNPNAPQPGSVIGQNENDKL